MGVTRQRDGVGASDAPRREKRTAASEAPGPRNGTVAPAASRRPAPRAAETGTRPYRYGVPGWGVGELTVRDGVLVAHALPSPRRAAARAATSLPAGPPTGGAGTPGFTLPPDSSHECDAFVPDLCRRFAAHLAGTPVSYDDVLVAEEGLTPFQRELLAAARSVPWGEIVTYGGLAALAGRPRAARAAGSFCAQSRLSLVVPCHRVVAAGKDEPFGIGGYGSSGLRLKRRLLALEGTVL
ncbi:MAG TPA: methylated-DNA--[protein]-cysteine S-methyltransferase [Gaiella sp.]|nr:methylated-DNA--[protein]-cysteine S-methyltransferase [Gaiella sp.]